jgi:hypothetical protein
MNLCSLFLRLVTLAALLCLMNNDKNTGSRKSSVREHRLAEEAKQQQPLRQAAPAQAQEATVPLLDNTEEPYIPPAEEPPAEEETFVVSIGSTSITEAVSNDSDDESALNPEFPESVSIRRARLEQARASFHTRTAQPESDRDVVQVDHLQASKQLYQGRERKTEAVLECNCRQ